MIILYPYNFKNTQIETEYLKFYDDQKERKVCIIYGMLACLFGGVSISIYAWLLSGSI
jgi:hypothetical protein